MLIVAYFTASVNIAQMCEVFPTWPDAPNQNLIIIPIIEFDSSARTHYLSPSVFAGPLTNISCAADLFIGFCHQLYEPRRHFDWRVH